MIIISRVFSVFNDVINLLVSLLQTHLKNIYFEFRCVKTILVL